MSEYELVISGGRIIDQTGERSGDVAIADGRIVQVGPDLDGLRVLDARGCVVAPGLVDLHANLRQPGHEEAETIESGSRSAVLGGYTAVVAMPSTSPAIDSAAAVREVQVLAASALCDVEVAGAITVGRDGERLAPMAEMAELGVRLFTDDGRGVQDERIMRRALEYASGLGVTLAQHCDVATLSQGGHMHEGEVSSRLGIPGIPAEAEEIMVMRDIALSRLTGSRVHFQHLSTAGSVAMVQAARSAGLDVTAEAAPHHFALTDAEIAGFDPAFKVSPPLRPPEDVAAIRNALATGVIDAIATDHAPHAPDTKQRPFDHAPSGMIGLETALSVALTELDLPLADVLALMSWRPAEIAGIADRHGRPVADGSPANLVVISPDDTWTVDASRLASLSRNTGFDGATLRGRVRHTIVGGEAVVVDTVAQR